MRGRGGRSRGTDKIKNEQWEQRKRNAGRPPKQQEHSVSEREQLISEIRAAQQALDLGLCPNCSATLTATGCPACDFSFHTLPPPHYDPRAGFNRRPTKRSLYIPDF